MEQKHIEILKTGVEGWNKWRDENPSVVPDLTDADLCKELLSIKRSFPEDNRFPWIDDRSAKLSGPILNEINFSNCQMNRVNLRGATLGGAIFRNARLTKACLQDAFMVGADMRECSLAGTHLEGATLSGADFRNSYMNGYFSGAHLSKADIRGANLRYSDISGSRIHDIRYNSKTLFRGIDLTGVRGCPSFVQYAKHQSYLEEMRESKWKRTIYFIWKITSNCGRSWMLWGLWSCIFTTAFAIWFYSLGEHAFNIAHLPWSFSTALYYSIITFTTLGFGDITPVTGSAAVAVAAEVITGYVMLGGLVSLVSSKISQRL